MRAFGYEMPWWGAVRLLIVRATCTHPNMEFHAATGVVYRDACNGEVGVVARCPTCRRAWSGDVVSGLGAGILMTMREEKRQQALEQMSKQEQW